MRRRVCLRHASIDIVILYIPVVIGQTSMSMLRQVDGCWKESERDVRNVEGWGGGRGYKTLFYFLFFSFVRLGVHEAP